MNTSPSKQTNSRLALFLSVLALMLGGYSLVDRFAGGTVHTQLGDPEIHSAQNLTNESATKGDSIDETERNDQPDHPSYANTPRVILPNIAASMTLDAVEAEAKLVVDLLMNRLPDEPMALHVSALLNAQLHESEKAKELWSRCIELSPSTEQYYINLATLTLDRGNSEFALETLENAEERGIKSLDISIHKATALSNLGRLEEAIEEADKALIEYPESSALWIVSGQAHLSSGDSVVAEKNLRKGIELGSKTKAAYFALVNACMRNGKREDAKKFREIYEGFTPSKRVDPSQRYEMISEFNGRELLTFILSESALIYQKSGLLREAELRLLRILALNPSDREALSRLVELYTVMQRPRDKKLVRARILELGPQRVLDYLRLARSAADSGDFNRAEAIIKLAITYAPQSVPTYSAMTDFLLEQNRPRDAQWYVEQALQVEPSEQGFRLLARTLRVQGKEAEAQQIEEQISQFAD